MTGDERTEKDTLGEARVPGGAYWGIHTFRARENFRISGIPLSAHPDLVEALATVKQAAARANGTLGQVPPARAAAISAACGEIIAGALRDQFVVDVVQGGAGTSTNMNTNEVIANRALELLGHRKGQYAFLSPLDDVNRGQSTNDTYPTAVKLALVSSLRRYITELERLEAAFQAKGRELAGVVKMGRTQLQEAVPMTLGQEFRAFASGVRKEAAALRQVLPDLCEINLGGTAIGTGIATHPLFAETARRELAEITGLPLRTAEDLIEATSDTGAFVHLGGATKRSAVRLSKISNDLRLLSSGPRMGFAEIRLPARQAGSSIMPGKINPVIPEVVSQAAYAAIGADATVTAAAEAGQLQLNAFEPIMAHCLLQALEWMTRAAEALHDCVRGIEPNTETLKRGVASSPGLATALVASIGYARATAVAKRSLADGRPVEEVVVDLGYLSAAEAAASLGKAALGRSPALVASDPTRHMSDC